MSDIKNVRLKDFRVYMDEESESLCLALIYEYEAKDGIHELHIPKLALRICDKEMPEIDVNHYAVRDDEIYADVGYHEYRLFNAKCSVPDKFGELHQVETSVVDCLVKEIKKEMTVEEIEKALGYGVKIVDKKGDIDGR